MVIFFSFHPAPYRDPVIEAFQRLIGSRLHVYFLYPIDIGHQEWKHSSQVSTTSEYAAKNLLSRYTRIFWLIWKSQVVFVPCYHLPEAWWMILLSILFKKKYILSFDTTGRQKNRLSYMVNKLVIFPNASYFFVPGNATRNYLINTFKICNSRIILGFYLMSPALTPNFNTGTKSNNENSEILNNLTGKKIILFIGKLIKSRRVSLLLEVFESLHGNNLVLIIVGSGPEFETVKSSINRINSFNRNSVLLIPSVPLSQLGNILRIANCYIHPGKEPFSTAVQLAYFYKIPIVASLEVGVVHDLIFRENPPCLYDYYSADSLRDQLQYTIDNLVSCHKCDQTTASMNIYLHPERVAEQLFISVTKLGVN